MDTAFLNWNFFTAGSYLPLWAVTLFFLAAPGLCGLKSCGMQSLKLWRVGLVAPGVWDLSFQSVIEPMSPCFAESFILVLVSKDSLTKEPTHYSKINSFIFL